MGAPITHSQLQMHERLQHDLEFYARKCLRIRTKEGAIKPFIFNKAQLYIHERIEEQLAETGMVRAVILKGRQQGCSTYVGARYFHKAVWNDAKSVYILSHEADSTRTLFNKVSMFHDKLPSSVRPKTITQNRNQLEFENNSEYTVGTAGSKNTGRGNTTQYFHGSEAAFYDNADSLLAGVFQTMGDVPGTERIIESTANGIGNWFHQTCMDALAGRGRYILIFVPWFWQDEYRAKPPKDFQFDDKEREIQRNFGLDDEQLYWRHLKVIELKSERLFKQEYPCSVMEAFQATGDSFLSSESVMRARKTVVDDSHAPLIFGVDPARRNDRTTIVGRRGRQSVYRKQYDEMDQMRLAGILVRLVEDKGADAVFVDYGMGYGTVDRCHELGYSREIIGVSFSERPAEPQYLNKRAEMAFNFKDWLEAGECSIFDDEEIETDLLAVPDFDRNSRGLLFLPPKDKIREIYGKSPDWFDAYILTFAHPVRSRKTQNERKITNKSVSRGSSLTTVNRRRAVSRNKSNVVPWGPGSR